MPLRIRFIGGSDQRLKDEIAPFARWLRGHYSFPIDFELRLVNQRVLRDFDGAKCYLRWWQTSSEKLVVAEIAVGNFGRNLAKEGPTVAYPTVVAAIGRALKYYFQILRDEPRREDRATRFGDRLMDAYISDSKPPPPWRGA